MMPDDDWAAIKRSHAWATEELATASPGSIRADVLQEERCRLAGIAERLLYPRRQVAPRYPARREAYLGRKGE
jgi:hypothetical protein